MPFETIHKDPAAFRVPPNLASYEEERANFSWERARSGIDGLPAGGLNIAYEAVDRHAIGAQAGKVALRTLDDRGHAPRPQLRRALPPDQSIREPVKSARRRSW